MEPKIALEKETLLENKDAKVTLTYNLKGTEKQSMIQIIGDKMQCPFCNNLVKNIKLHFSRAAKCGNRIDLHSFSKIYETYQVEKNRERKKKNYLEQKERCSEKLKKRNNEAVKKYQEKLKAENKELFDQSQLDAVIKYQEKLKAENKDLFEKNQGKKQS